ncbi:hypothetical protein [Demequina sp. NBRC 110056]|uniref:hypothetical protein n=1 Tax=Demequina sp. NBRC 110056 TaxID=1570345 RepID=UPI00117DD78A|nr:hypothetical protein [Demequina sp. NBRC 110056]
MADFERHLNDKQRGFAFEDASSRLGLVAFGGIKGGLVVPPFEFFSLLSDTQVTKLFVRDLEQCWYARGVPGLGENLREVATSIEALASKHGFRPVFVGVSAGGFAAVAAAALTGSAEAHVFSPQVSLRWADRVRMRDGRWPEHVARLRDSPDPILDLRPLLRSAPGTRVSIHVSQADQLDMRHAKLVERLPNVDVHRYADGGHQVVKHLRDSGDLSDILHGALGLA